MSLQYPHLRPGVFRHAWLLPLFGKTVHDLLEDPATQIKFHRFATFFWLANMLLVTVVFFVFPGVWATASIFYLVIISVYSNFSTEFDALSASQASLHGTEARDTAAALDKRLKAVESRVKDLGEE